MEVSRALGGVVKVAWDDFPEHVADLRAEAARLRASWLGWGRLAVQYGGWCTPKRIVSRALPYDGSKNLKHLRHLPPKEGDYSPGGAGALERYFLELARQHTGVQRLYLQRWVVGLENGDWIDLHDHGQAIVAGSFCLDPGGEPTGVLELMQDVGNATREEEECVLSSDQVTWRVELDAGELVLFPGNMPHRVTMHRGEGERVTVAFNAVRAEDGEE